MRNDVSSIKILVTGGHMTPALAVISELQSRGYKQFIWVGHKFNQHGNKNPSAEFTTVSAKHIKFIDLKAGKLTRNWSGDGWRAGIVNLIKIPWGIIHSFWIVTRYRPELILSFGGYLALPVAIAGRLLGRKVLTHEQTAVTGLTNKIIPKFAHKIMISWPSSAKYYPAEKTILTGNPLRPEILTTQSTSLQLNDNLPTIYITGGNQGSHIMNVVIFEVLAQLLEITNIIHQTGNSSITNDFDTATRLRSQLINQPGKYLCFPYIYEDQIGEVMNKASLVIARSGANTVYEVLALAKPSIFIPIPWVTHNEQYINASLAQDVGLAKILAEEDLSPESLLQTVRESLHQLSQNGTISGGDRVDITAKAQNIIIPNAQINIANQVDKILNVNEGQ